MREDALHKRRMFSQGQFIAAATAGSALCIGMLAGMNHAHGATMNPATLNPKLALALPQSAPATAPAPRLAPLSLAHSYSVPAYGSEEHITRVYQAGDGHFVLGFSFRDHGVAKADYFDTLKNTRLFPDQEAAMAADGGWRWSWRLPKGLKPLTPDTIFNAGNGASVHADSEGGDRCGFPYALPITIDPPGGRPQVRIELFEKRPAPGFWKGACGDEAVALHYEETGYQLFYAGGDGFLVDTDSRHLVFVGWDGHCDLSADNRDIIAVPYEEFRDVLFDGAEESEGPGPDNFARAEAFIKSHAR